MIDTAITIGGNALALLAIGGLIYMIFMRPFQ